jgi:hypothetical protein
MLLDKVAMLLADPRADLPVRLANAFVIQEMPFLNHCRNVI